MLLRKAYRFRLEPTKEQEQALLRQAGARRFVYNWALARRQAYYREHGVGISAKQLSAELTALKNQPDTVWLKEMDAQSLQQALRDLDRAYGSFFAKRSRYPKFRSRKTDSPRFRTPQAAKLVDGKVYVPKIGLIRLRQSREVPEEVKSATFKRDACGHWFVTLTVEFEGPDDPIPAPPPKSIVGIDLGLKAFATLSDGGAIESPKFGRHADRKLKRAHRRLSRKQKGSRNREKARQKLARAHQKVRNQRSDFVHQATTRLTREHEAFALEDLCVKGLAKTKLARSVMDAALGEFRRQMQYKCLWQRKHCLLVSRFYPSSKTCCQCGWVKRDLTLSDRHWICQECGAEHDRDLNAAKNLKAEGLKQLAVGLTESENACGVRVRPLSEAVDAEAGIPCL